MSIDFNLALVTENTVMGSHEAGRSNAGAVVLNDFVVAIDCTMWPHTARLFRQALEDTYKKPVKYLLLTHSHGDHIMGLSAFSDAAIIASKQLPHSLRKRQQTQWKPEQMQEMKSSGMAPPEWIEEVQFLIPPVLFHSEIEIINDDQPIEIHHSGGHTDDSSWAYFPQEKVLFAGDLIFSEMMPYAGDDTCDPEKWMDLLRKWLKMPIDKVIPGHGPVMGLEIVERILMGFEQLKQDTLEAIAESTPADKIAIPSAFNVPEDATWLVQKTLNHWYQYYSNNNH